LNETNNGMKRACFVLGISLSLSLSLSLLERACVSLRGEAKSLITTSSEPRKELGQLGRHPKNNNQHLEHTQQQSRGSLFFFDFKIGEMLQLNHQFNFSCRLGLREYGVVVS
jgi:hypothetical protein